VEERCAVVCFVACFASFRFVVASLNPPNSHVAAFQTCRLWWTGPPSSTSLTSSLRACCGA
jgi:hypothetical protein